jgi:hypothetical protein
VDPRERIDAALDHLKALGVRKGSAAPPLWRLCWWLGWFVPPPHFLGFLPLALFAGGPFGLLLSALLTGSLLAYEPGTVEMAAPYTALFGFSAGAPFGLALAVYYRWSAWRLGVPRWSDFDPGFDTDDDTW